jgi:hypothetical protein
MLCQQNYDLPGLNLLLEYKQGLENLLHWGVGELIGLYI